MFTLRPASREYGNHESVVRNLEFPPGTRAVLQAITEFPYNGSYVVNLALDPLRFPLDSWRVQEDDLFRQP